MTHNNPSNWLLSRNDVEREYGLGRRWLELAAMRGDGPPMRRISARMIRYQRAELEAWLASRKVASTSQGCAK
jgi:predicted DNA-binding transcriptional regulator AlpA